MKAPDVIYLSPIIYNSMTYRDFDEETETYIRKEALLEWVKECFRLHDGGSWYSKGSADAYSIVINKLNEL